MERQQYPSFSNMREINVLPQDLLVFEEIRFADHYDGIHCRREKPHKAHHGHTEGEDGSIGGGVATHLTTLAIACCWAIMTPSKKMYRPCFTAIPSYSIVGSSVGIQFFKS